MNEIHTGDLPDHAFLRKYAQEGAYTDCYYVDLAGHVSHDDYVTAFYCSRVFRAERALLGLLVRRPASDADAARLGKGETGRFSAWDVEARDASQLLMREFTGATRSWLMSERLSSPAGPVTRLYFGSAAIARRRYPSGEPRFSRAFHALMGFHQSYSRALLKSACSALLRRR